jgi:hypothetical protein
MVSGWWWSGEDVLLAVLPPIVGLLPPRLDGSLVPVDFIDVLIVLLNDGLLLVELLQDVLVDLLHHFHLLQFPCDTLVILQGVLCYFLPQSLLDLCAEDVGLWGQCLCLAAWTDLYDLLSDYVADLATAAVLVQDGDFEDEWFFYFKAFLHGKLESKGLVNRPHSKVQTHPILVLGL